MSASTREPIEEEGEANTLREPSCESWPSPQAKITPSSVTQSPWRRPAATEMTRLARASSPARLFPLSSGLLLLLFLLFKSPLSSPALTKASPRIPFKALDRIDLSAALIESGVLGSPSDEVTLDAARRRSCFVGSEAVAASAREDDVDSGGLIDGNALRGVGCRGDDRV